MPVAFVPYTPAPTHPGAFRNTQNEPAGATALGQPVLSDVLGAGARFAVEIAFGANVKADPSTWQWVDVTVDLSEDRDMQIRQGRADETSQASPATVDFRLDNTTGRYSAYFPGSPYFPNVKRSTPVRVRATVDGITWYVRFQGYAKGFTPSWNPTGNIPTASVAAAGTLQRYQQGRAPLRTPLARATLASNPAVYWPLEDGSSATQAASGLSGGTAMVPSGTVKFGSATGPTGSASVPDLSSGGSFTGVVTNTGSTAWTVALAVKFPTLTGTQSVYAVQLTSNYGTVPIWQITAFPSGLGGLEVTGFSDSGGTSFGIGTGHAVDDNQWHWVKITVAQAGTDVSVLITLDGTDLGLGYVLSQTLGPIAAVRVNPTQPNGLYPTVGHVAIWNAATVADMTSAFNGWTGETATARLARLCTEQGETITVTGTSTVTMGAQAADIFVNLLRQCETADGGVLGDGLGPGFYYLARSAKYNQTVALSLDASNGELTGPFAPVDDDQRIRNLIDVSRTSGSSATFEDADDPQGTNQVGDYESSLTVATNDDSTLLFRAAWEAHVGTVNGLRYPSVSWDLLDVPSKAAAWLAAPLGGRVAATNPAQLFQQLATDTIDLLLEGYLETIGRTTWAVAANCSSYLPWRVATIEGAGDLRWRIDSGGSSLAADYPAGSTSLSVLVNDGYLWSTVAADYPVDLDVGGVKVTATAVSGTGSPQAFTVQATAYRLVAGWPVKLWRPATIAL